MIKRKNDLFELIHSLSPSEKRHFRLFSALFKKEKNNYQSLYDAIENQIKYDEKEIVKVFHDKKFIKHLDIKKHYLYNLILKSLANYHSKSNNEDFRLFQVEVLISKSLYRQAYTLLEVEKKKALETEKTQLLLCILEQELTLHRFFGYREKESILNDLIHYTDRFNNELQYRRLYTIFRIGIDQYMFIRSIKQKKKYDEILSHPLMKTHTVPQSFIAAHCYCVLRFWKYGTLGNWNLSLKYAKENYDLLLKKKNVLNDFFQEYVFVYNNLIASAIKANKYSLFKKYHLELKKISSRINSSHERSQILFVYNVMNTIYLNNSGHWNEAKPIINEAEDFVENHIKNIDELRANSFYFNLAKVYFGVNDFKSAYRWLNKIISTENKNESTDFHAFSRLIFCLCCFERGDLELMLYILKPTKRYMIEKKIMYQFEKRFIYFLEKQSVKLVSMNHNEKVELYANLKKDFTEIFKSPFERNVLNYFWFDRWVNGKTA